MELIKNTLQEEDFELTYTTELIKAREQFCCFRMLAGELIGSLDNPGKFSQIVEGMSAFCGAYKGTCKAKDKKTPAIPHLFHVLQMLTDVTASDPDSQEENALTLKAFIDLAYESLNAQYKELSEA